MMSDSEAGLFEADYLDPASNSSAIRHSVQIAAEGLDAEIPGDIKSTRHYTDSGFGALAARALANKVVYDSLDQYPLQHLAPQKIQVENAQRKRIMPSLKPSAEMSQHAPLILINLPPLPIHWTMLSPPCCRVCWFPCDLFFLIKKLSSSINLQMPAALTPTPQPLSPASNPVTQFSLSSAICSLWSQHLSSLKI